MLEGQPTTPALPDLDDSWLPAPDRPEIVVNGPESTVELIKVALGVLVAANERKPTLFVLQGRLMHVVHDEAGYPRLVRVTSTWLRGHLMRVARWIACEAGKDGERRMRDVLPPSPVVRDIFSHGDWPFPPAGNLNRVLAPSDKEMRRMLDASNSF